MSVILEHRQHVLAPADLRVVREGIRFRDVAPGRVRIEIDVENRGSRASEPTILTLESAPLGAFLPWSPLDRVPVGPIAPGGVRVVTVEAERRAVVPLGDFGSVPPSVLVAAAAPEEERRGGTGTLRSLQTLRIRRVLAPDVFELLNRKNVYWAGNLNVFIGSRSVERHMAQALRVEPGRVNIALFMVGSGGKEAYAFDLDGSAVSWSASLSIARVAPLEFLLGPRQSLPIVPGIWIETTGCTPVMLELRPPQNCEEGKVDVHVRQRSTGKEAVVEFNLDPRAAGPGCYVV